MFYCDILYSIVRYQLIDTNLALHVFCHGAILYLVVPLVYSKGMCNGPGRTRRRSGRKVNSVRGRGRGAYSCSSRNGNGMETGHRSRRWKLELCSTNGRHSYPLFINIRYLMEKCKVVDKTVFVIK